MRSYTKDISRADSAEAVSLFYTLSALLEKMPVLGGDTRAAWIILLDSMEKWIDMRSIDERSSDIDRILVSLQRKITRKVRAINSLKFISSIIKSLTDRWGGGGEGGARGLKGHFFYFPLNPTGLENVMT